MTLETPLPALDGRTPLGFLAALGAQATFTDHHPPALRWDTTGTPTIIGYTLDEIADRALHTYHHLAAGPAVTGPHVKHDLKFTTPTHTRAYLHQAHTADQLTSAFAAAQVPEGAYAVNRRAKPSALHFTSGRQQFLTIAHDIADALSPSTIRDALTTPSNGLTLLRWGTTDGRIHALSHTSPATHKERRRVRGLTSAAPTALALLGMSHYPTWADHNNRCVTQGFVGPWPHRYVWPLWAPPATPGTVNSLLAQAHPRPDKAAQQRYPQWGITELWSAHILPGGQGYLSFSDAHAVWHTHTPPSGTPPPTPRTARTSR